MAKPSSVALLGLFLLPGLSSALEIINIRPCYGLPLGAKREDTKCIPGDYLFMTYDIDGLKVDEKSGKVSYVTKFELLDNKGTVFFKKETPTEIVPQLGGSRVPGELAIQTVPKQEAGKYQVRLTITDRHAKESKAFVYDYDVLPPQFGFVGVTAPGIGFPGQSYVAGFALVNMALDKEKMPSVDIMMRVLDATGKKEVSKPAYSNLPKDMPDDANLEKENFVLMQFPIYLNRPGNFIVEINAADKTAKKTVQLKYPLTVIEAPTGK